MWSEKAACTAVVKWFFYHIGKLDEALAHHRWIHHYENDVFKQTPNYAKSCRKALNSGTPVIKFVRNPYTRAYSGYLETCRRRVLTDEDHWSKDVRKQVLEFLTGDSAEMEYGYSFNQFTRWLAAQPLDTLDHHLAPQFQDYERNLDVRHIRLEDHEHPFAVIEDELGLSKRSDLSQLAQSGHHHPKTPRPAKEAVAALDLAIPVSRQQSFQIFDATADVIEQSPSGAVLHSLFAADFEAYGYRRSSAEVRAI